jgi:hypothetical protein
MSTPGRRCAVCAGRNHPPISDEARFRMRTSHLGQRLDDVRRAKLIAALTGRIVSEEQREKTRAKLMGHPVSPETRKKISEHHLATMKSPEYRKRLSNSAKKRWSNPGEREIKSRATKEAWGNPDIRVKYSGPNAHFWRGGCFEPYGPDFNDDLKNKIRKRDDYLCQNPKCYLPENGHHHDCHHIDYEPKHNEFDNLILLCRKCHAKTTVGKRDFFQEYYQCVQEARGIIR